VLTFRHSTLAGLLFFSLSTAAKQVEVLSQWVVPAPMKTSFELGITNRTSPVVVGDFVYIGRADGKVSAIHRVHGNVLWEVKLPGHGEIDGAFAYGRSKIFVGDNKGNLYALYARDGSVAWHFKGNTEWLSPPVVARDRVFITTSADEIYALGESDGKEKWHYSQRGDEKMTVRGTGAPAVFGNEVYVGFSDGYLVALAAASGRTLWKQKLRSRDRFYDIDMMPYVDEKSVIAATFDGSLFSLNRTSGETQWVLRVGSYGGFLVEDNRVYFSGLNGSFMAVDREAGTPIWKTAFESGVGMTPVRVGEYLAVSTSGDPLYLLNPADGKVVWSGSFGAGAMAPVVSHPDGFFYSMSNFGNVFSFGIMTRENAPPKVTEILEVPSALLRFG